MKREAILSEDRVYRYLLVREWREPVRRKLLYVMLNPSSADALADDPTVRQCVYFAAKHGYDGLEVVNQYAYRSPHPKTLLTVKDPVGPANDRHLAKAVARCDAVCVAWGSAGGKVSRKRTSAVLRLIREALRRLHRDETLYCLGRNTDGQPVHPCRLPRNAGLIPF